MAITSIITTSILSYIITALFISACLHTRAHIDTLKLITMIWFFGFLPLILATKGNISLIFHLLGQPDSAILTKANPTPITTPTTLQKAIVYITYSVMIGAFAFSIYVPLDSETILQQWPIAPMIGSAIGFIIGCAIAMYKVTSQTTSR